MSILLVFDQYMNIGQLKKKLRLFKIDKLDLFPLTSNWNLIHIVESMCYSISSNITEINLLESAKLINDQVGKVRNKICKWSAELGNCKVWGKSIKEWFLTPKKEVSTWWFTLLSEKNTLKTDVFFRIAQTQAIVGLLKSNKYRICYLSTGEKRLKKIVKKLCEKYSIQLELLVSSFVMPYTKKELIKRYLKAIGFWGDILHSLIWLVRFTIKGLKAKKIMGSLNNRQIKKDSILFISYFPAVDKEAAKTGIFKNKYAIPLQNKLSEINKAIIWLFMYVSLNGWSYDDALRLGKNFANSGEVNFFIEEFLSIRVILNSIFIWVAQIFKYLVLSSKLNPKFLTENLTIPESNILLYPVWRQSFVGATGIEAIVYFELYKKVFDYINNTSHCIYYLEMHAWEKALNAAKKLRAQNVKTIGFQHTSIQKNYFHYFHNYEEMKVEGRSTDLPLPDILACNGNISYELMAERKYPNLKKVEAIRQLYLNNVLSNTNYTDKKIPVLLVAGSIDRNETIALISLVNSTFPKKQSFRIWLKGHPSMPVEGILESLNVDSQKCGYEIKHDSIDILLKEATMVMVGTSTVALEALAFGCRVILPIFSDRMFMSPLAEFEEYYDLILNPDDLRETAKRVFKTNTKDVVKSKAFISQYWCLNDKLESWREVLKD